MTARGRGSLVNVSSLAGVTGLRGAVPYSASEAALSHVTAALRDELTGLPVHPTLVEVGPVPTDMLDEVEQQPRPQRPSAGCGDWA